MSTRLFKDEVIFTQRFLACAGFYKATIDGDWGPKTEAANTAFEVDAKQIATDFGTFDMRTESRIMTLLPKTQILARQFMKRVQNLGNGNTVKIISGTRTYGEQTVLYRQGRFGNPGPIITNAKAGQSNHNFGLAWDIGIFKNGQYLGESPLYKEVPKTGLVAGLEWGGDWKKFTDRPHYQISVELALAQVRAKFEVGKPFV
jgi:peptidoglycan LD-endopeptidase CwlK